MKFAVVFLAAIVLCTSAFKLSLLENIKGSTIKAAILGMKFPSIKGEPEIKLITSYLVKNVKINAFDLTAADLTINADEYTLTLANVKLTVFADIEANIKFFGQIFPQKLNAIITTDTESAALGLTYSKATGLFKVSKCEISMSKMDVAFGKAGFFKNLLDRMASEFIGKLLGIGGTHSVLCPMVENLINGFLFKHIKEDYPELVKLMVMG